MPDILSSFPLNYAYDDDETISIQDNWFQGWLFNLTNLNLGAGTNNLDLLTVPAMELVTIDCSAMLYTGGVPTNMFLCLTVGGINYPFHMETTIVNGEWLVAYPKINVPPLYNVRAFILGATAGNDFDVRLIGTRYKFRDD